LLGKAIGLQTIRSIDRRATQAEGATSGAFVANVQLETGLVAIFCYPQ